MSVGATEAGRLQWSGLQLLYREAAQNLHQFGPAVTRTPDGRPLEFSLLHLAWIAHVEYCWERGLHAGVFGAGGAGFAVTLAAWILGRDAAARVGLVCNSTDHARLRGKMVRQIATSERYGRIFPGALGSVTWTDNTAAPAGALMADPILEVRAASSRPVGSGFTHLLFEGVTDAATTSTEDRREDQRRQVETAWLARLAPGGKILWVAQPCNPGDVSYTLRQRADFCWLEQRQRADGGGWEQEILNAGEDYQGLIRDRLVSMLAASR